MLVAPNALSGHEGIFGQNWVWCCGYVGFSCVLGLFVVSGFVMVFFSPVLFLWEVCLVLLGFFIFRWFYGLFCFTKLTPWP